MAEADRMPHTCLPSLGDPCGNCHRCTDPDRDDDGPVTGETWPEEYDNQGCLKDADNIPSDRVRAYAEAVVKAWDDHVAYEPCTECLQSGVALWPFESDEAVDAAVEALRAALRGPEPTEGDR